MAETTFSLTGRNSFIALAVVMLVVVVRFTTIGESTDPLLEQAIRAELRNVSGGELGKVLDDIDVSSEEDVDEALALADEDNVTLHSVRVSKPLFSISSSTAAVVRLQYALPDRAEQTEYWLFDDNVIGGWRYKYKGTALSYYLNFI